MERLEDLFGLLSLRAHPMAQTFPTAIMLSVSYTVSYVGIIPGYISLEERFDEALLDKTRANNR